MASIQIVVARFSLLRVREVKFLMRSVAHADHDSEKESTLRSAKHEAEYVIRIRSASGLARKIKIMIPNEFKFR